MHSEKHWIRPATLNEKRLCRIRLVIFLIFFVMTLISAIWLIQSGDADHAYFPALVCFLFYVFSMILDAAQVLTDKKIRINDQADVLTRDKWYHFFVPLSPGMLTVGWIVILLLIGAVGFFIYSLFAGKPM
ncbi:MAG: hypothetical protein PHT53_06420 [Candidatus Omnitrophica bacterium]|nr:hypothetical protein [Candidatus Omnitrophota bacterium]